MSETTVETALQRYLRSLDAGGTIDTLRWVLVDGDESFLVFCHEASVEYVDEIDTQAIRQWGLQLQERTRDGEIAASTAHNYFAYVRAFLEFCVRDRLKETNPAKTDRAKEYLPEDTEQRDRQFWDDEAREAILNFVQRRVDEAYDDDDLDVETVYRDRALVTLLALSGVRGAEVFRDPNDDLRNGLQWSDVDFEQNTITVFGKSRTYEGVGLFETTRDALDRWHQVQDPPTDEWPVFPTGHYPSRKRALVDALGEARTDEVLTEASIDEALRTQEVPPPSISKNGARRLMQRLCEAAEIDIDGEYLKPHGGRRGLGHKLYASGEAVTAQKALRHQSIKTTHDSYQDLQPSQVAEQVADVLHDGNDDDSRE